MQQQQQRRSEKMDTKLEAEFQKALLEKCRKAEEKCGVKCTRLINNIEKYGAVKTVKEIIRKRNVSDSYDGLERAGRLDLTAEAAAAESRFAALFTDDEVNYCFSVLCESGYYNV